MENSDNPSIEGNAAFAENAATIAAHARVQIDVFSHQLEPALWASPDFVEAVKRCVIERSRSQVRILLSDAGPLARDGSRLLDLTRQLSSSIEIRQVSSMHRDVDGEWLLVDESRSLIREPSADRVAHRDDDSRVTVKRKRDRFDRMWDASDVPPGLRRLHI